MGTAQEFENAVLQLFEDLDEDKKEEIQVGLARIRQDLKRKHPRVSVSTSSILVGIVAAMFYMENGKNLCDMKTQKPLKRLDT